VEVEGQKYLVKINQNSGPSAPAAADSSESTSKETSDAHSVITSPLEGKFFLTKDAGEIGIKIGDMVKKGDTVQIISGKDKGKIGEVLETVPANSTVVVKGVNIRTKHVKPQQEGESGQIKTYEAPIHSSKVMLYSNKEKIASRICYTFTDDGRKVRMLKKTGEILDK
jgi:large subunit ribosomal protein L24